MKNGNALHVYYGDGKGKTTAAMGLAVRALGTGRRVLIAQFLKRNDSGELKSLARLDGARIVLGEPILKLTSRMTPEELAQEKIRQRGKLERIERIAQEASPELIVLDEILVAVHLKLIDESTVIADIDDWLSCSEVVCTGRWVSESILSRADYITRMVKERHPYDQGVKARLGIEL